MWQNDELDSYLLVGQWKQSAHEKWNLAEYLQVITKVHVYNLGQLLCVRIEYIYAHE